MIMTKDKDKKYNKQIVVRLDSDYEHMLNVLKEHYDKSTSDIVRDGLDSLYLNLVLDTS